jgi:hypothetical protein
MFTFNTVNVTNIMMYVTTAGNTLFVPYDKLKSALIANFGFYFHLKEMTTDTC